MPVVRPSILPTPLPPPPFGDLCHAPSLLPPLLLRPDLKPVVVESEVTLRCDHTHCPPLLTAWHDHWSLCVVVIGGGDLEPNERYVCILFVHCVEFRESP